jgi:DNA polymerase-3 subunit epsilon
MRQIFLDTETTGLSADNGDRVIEIGCVELFNRKLTGNNKHFYLNPGRDSHEEALKVHGITSEFLKDKPKFEAVADDLLEYLQDAEIIIHNAAFDVGFLNTELELIGRRTLHGALLDAELLADVYINLTRGQDALLIDLGSAEGAGAGVVQIDLRAFELPVLAANDQEISAHDDVLKQIDKASGGKTVWHASA